ncbi:MAG TPA: response regulator transcription factor [bacterium]|nr:response regulator transcription factor [bacterium]
MDRVRVLIVDDTTLMRQGLKSLLEHHDGVEFVGEATNAADATELAARLRPDVILLDVDMPGLDAAEAIRLTKQHHPEVEIIALAEDTDHQRAMRALEAGATGFVLKDISPDDLIRAIDAVCHGRTLMDPYVARQLIERLQTIIQHNNHNNNGNNHENGVQLGGLSGRELEILLEVTRGATDREIGQKLFLSTSTVKSHIHSILGKIGVKNRTQAVAYVLTNGLVRRRLPV